ncbi:hypothetical protein MLD38_000425 [Melastoma candidum]|uniref:Uncharacterized protein n=1 Tax=Melastoma candidum TaxID=119954 RepID=A0ACB9SDZ5_9MYRT|nr:hypothetical protein MLD38_000425 [Melastoma candidum]
MENADVFFGLHDFLERMRQPSAADIVKSIKSFIVSFVNNPPDPERDSQTAQGFLSNMEAVFRAHPLWAGCSEEELESAGEGLEKYVMTKLFSRVFASHPDDVKVDEQLSETMTLVQQFIRPEYLDIKPPFQNETSWLLAQKELQKINMCKAPRDKLVCILNCCKVINNLLMNASIASNESPPGADEFLPVLIFVTIKASPPQLHSNLLYIQRYRRQSRLVAEAAYYFTNMLSAEAFISNIDAKSLSMDESEFERNMESARALLSGLSTDYDTQSHQSNSAEDYAPRSAGADRKRPGSHPSKPPVTPARKSENEQRPRATSGLIDQDSISNVPSLSDLENKGATMLVKENEPSKTFQEYPYLFAQAGDLTVGDVEDLLSSYKQIAFKYICLSKGLGETATTSHPSLVQQAVTSTANHSDNVKSEEVADRRDSIGSVIDDDESLSKSSQNDTEEREGGMADQSWE